MRQRMSIIGNEEHFQFLVDHLGTETAQGFHTHGSLDIPKPQFNAPTARIKLSQFGRRVEYRIHQGGDEGDGLGPVARNRQGEPDHPDRQGLRQALPEALGDKARSLPVVGFAPDQQPVVFAQAFAFAEIPPAGRGASATGYGRGAARAAPSARRC